MPPGPIVPPGAGPVAENDLALLGGADLEPLFTGFSLGDLELRNRFVMAPMTRQYCPGGTPGPDVAAYYARRAPHVGLIVTEGTYIGHPSAGTSDRVPRFYGAEALTGWADVVAAVHAAGGRVVPQLWHLGAARSAGAPPHPTAPVISPSGIRADGTTVGEPATTAVIDQVIAAFVDAASDARAAGFDGVELHGAHGYLLDQFLWPVTNRRRDAYGGTPANRSRLAADIIAAIRGEVGSRFPVILRFSQWKVDDYHARIADSPNELEQLLAPLVESGASALHVSTRQYWRPAFEGSERTLAGWTKNITGLPVIAIGSVGLAEAHNATSDDKQSPSLTSLMQLFHRGDFDLIALGRVLLTDPAWPTKVRNRQLDQIRQYNKTDARPLY